MVVFDRYDLKNEEERGRGGVMGRDSIHTCIVRKNRDKFNSIQSTNSKENGTCVCVCLIDRLMRSG